MAKKIPNIVGLLVRIKMGYACVLYAGGLRNKLSIMAYGVATFLWELIGREIDFPDELYNRISRALIKDLIVAVNGLRFFVLDMDSMYVATPFFESQVWKYLRPKEGEVFIDVGAHIGRYAIQVAKMVGRDGLVIAIEPNRQNYEILLRNIKLNSLTNVIALNVAAWNKPLKLKLFLAVQSAGHSISKDHDRGYIEVEGKPIDSLLEQVKVQHVDWIKTDVEGADFEVIQGLRDTLTRHSPRVIVEVWNRNTLALLKDLDYMITPISSPSSYYFCVKRA